MYTKTLLYIGILILALSCGTEAVDYVPGEGSEGTPDIIAEGNLEATVDNESWPGKITSIEFTADGLREKITVVAERAVGPHDGEAQSVEIIKISISSNEGELLMEQQYSAPNFEVIYEEDGANLPDELWLASSGNADIIELSKTNIQVRFHAAMRLQKDVEKDNTSGEILFIEDGKFNKALDGGGDEPEERITILD